MKKPRTGYLVLRLQTSGETNLFGSILPLDLANKESFGMCAVYRNKRVAKKWAAGGKYPIIGVTLQETGK